jgi:hypothetical protein
MSGVSTHLVDVVCVPGCIPTVTQHTHYALSWVASSNSKMPALQAGDPGANPGRSTSMALSANGQAAWLSIRKRGFNSRLGH